MSFGNIGVVGSGIMGSGVAEVAASTGARVIVRSRSAASADAVLSTLEQSLAKQVEKAKRSVEEADAIRQRVSVTTELGDLAHCDLVIETVVEDLSVKKELFRALDAIVAPTTIVATCTSTLAVIDLAMEISNPDRVCGVHFFNPVPAMSLVEVVRPLSASDETIALVTEFVLACNKEPIEVKDQAGFIVNALLFPYLNNAVRLLEGGVATKEGIDAAMKGGCGFPMGPFALLDLVGLDTSVAILDALYSEFAETNYAPAPLLRRMVSAGMLGRKSGAGFYQYRK
ncbi:MAG TPA: 3-hydroxybutyryl-CoA dehydrogenase [Acidimicrobiales bacterium]|jgi:3-hydroxybutyryl-CoA dehydrogenase|nr:3-hydroxybutyryl-CoA dehydrogenase [Acidimicrobiales bacterium]